MFIVNILSITYIVWQKTEFLNVAEDGS